MDFVGRLALRVLRTGTKLRQVWDREECRWYKLLWSPLSSGKRVFYVLNHDVFGVPIEYNISMHLKMLLRCVFDGR
jgi:hypothetical protein